MEPSSASRPSADSLEPSATAGPTSRRTSTLVGRLLAPALFMSFSVAFFLGVRDLELESRALPQIVSALLVGTCALDLVRELTVWLRSERDDLINDDLRKVVDAWPKLTATVGLTLAFVASLAYVGFYAAMLVFMPTVLFVLGVRRPVMLATVTLGFAATTYLLFTVVLQIQMPAGALF